MQVRMSRIAIAAALIFLALFVMRFIEAGSRIRSAFNDFGPGIEQQFNQNEGTFEIGRKNYASSKKFDSGAASASPTPIGDSQKYEKIGSLTQVTNEYDADRKHFDELITANNGIVQLERATGLDGRRMLHLGIGVPPDRFDAFIVKAREIGKSVAIEVVKNDKTNEYLQLKAKRATLEKARAALEDLKAGGGSLDERVTVQNRLTDIEQQIQDLGVSLGEFDSQNELCTVKLTLRETVKQEPISFARRALRAFEAALSDYIYLGIGFFSLMAAAWIGLRVVSEARKLMTPPAS